jgi:hypothetical protein
MVVSGNVSINAAWPDLVGGVAAAARPMSTHLRPRARLPDTDRPGTAGVGGGAGLPNSSNC